MNSTTETETVKTMTFPVGTATITLRETDSFTDVTIVLETNTGAAFMASDGLFMPLTDCCHATAKGLDDYIGCRNCYEPVDERFGLCADIEDIRGCEDVATSILSEVYLVKDYQKVAVDAVGALRAEWDRQRGLDAKRRGQTK